jgi:UDP-D-galactose:(glucosyl)LPS alpha-1,6-D-galactosyltransferase
MRVAILVPMMSGRGGSETAVAGLVQGLQSSGDEAHVYLFGGLPTDPRWVESVPHTALGSRTETRWQRLRHYSLGLAKEFRHSRPDAVVALDSFRLLKGRLALTLSGTNAPLISFIQFPVDRIRMSKLLKIADGHMALCDGIAEQLRALVGKTPRERVFTTYEPVPLADTHMYRPRPGETVEFLHIGRLQFEGQKRVSDLLAAAARVTGDFKLTIIGDGGDRARLEQYSRELGVAPRITWLGWQESPWDHVSKASALLLTSSYEGFGIILVEALSRGIPCITSDCKYGPNEIVVHGQNGWLYPVGDIAQLTRLMQAIVANARILPEVEDVSASAQKFSAQAVTERAKFAFVSVAKSNARLHTQLRSPASNASEN